MKHLSISLILSFMCFTAISQNRVFSKDGKKISFQKEDLDIHFSPSPSVRFPDKVGAEAAPLLALIPTAIDWAFKTTTNIIEKRAKSFTAEYSKQKSYLEAAGQMVPDFKIERTLEINGTIEKALEIDVKAKKIDNINAFVYYIDNIKVKYANARTAKNDNTFDYTFEFKVTFIENNEKKTQELSPVTVSSIDFERTSALPALKYRTDLIPLPAGSVFAELAVKILETNPAKVRAEKILSTWNNNKDDIKTVINNFLPKNDDKTPLEGGGGDGGDKPGGSKTELNKK